MTINNYIQVEFLLVGEDADAASDSFIWESYDSAYGYAIDNGLDESNIFTVQAYIDLDSIQ